ncbi:Ubiquitin carboxyl-terminal hydrolase isozyme L3 [Porphyridium purpureum]|uniref:Ubiquitin carboxyl-terminal hydrolase n=1 Tax=Porphyridium purpureum TaxID=35688 RepID=A0A5J4Z5Y9_PORPP|nr:Ubiquitin carboxyl-terminal hydrolase isozyme L3 [Porphyridium purpureum]|eukprot:POR3209..scf295_1
MQWVPLESNPDVLTSFLEKLGVDGDAAFADVYSIDLLEFVPRPVLALVLLYPLTPQTGRAGDRRVLVQDQVPEGLFFCKQTIGNACGTIGVLHAVANNRHALSIRPGSFFDEYLDECASLDPATRAQRLESNKALGDAHAETARQGQTEAPREDEDVDLHFVCFVHCAGKLLELDGRQAGPIDRGSTSPATLLEDACAAVKLHYMDANPGEMRFTMLALASKT